MGTRRKFTDEFKREAVKLATQPGVALTTVSRELGVQRSVLRRPVESGQYSSEDFQRLLSAHGITCSMSRRGDCWDNAGVESFFSSPKTKRIDRRQYATRDEAWADVFDYIERLYNPRRRHPTLDYLRPIQFVERSAAL